MAIPEWLTKDYLLKVLRHYHKDNELELLWADMRPAFGKGENYGGFLTKAHVKYQLSQSREKQEKHLLIKNSHENDEFLEEKMKEYDIFQREMSIYDRVLPKLNELLKEISDPDQLFATALYADYERQVLVFEDLTYQGYTMANRIERLDVDHVHLILRKLAKMHATSAVLNERQPGCLEVYDRGFFNKYTDSYKGYFLNNMLASAKYLKQSPQTRHYAEKIETLVPHYMQLGLRCFTPTAGHVNVLCHGDVWTNNVMFKYDKESGKPIDVLLIDFQYSFWGSPTLDLHHFFNTSLQESLRRHEQDGLMQYFHRYFADTLRKLKYTAHPIPSLKNFHLQAEQKGFFAVHCAIVIQPVMLNQDASDADFNALLGEDERSLNFKNRLYTNPVIQNNLKFLVPLFDRKGLLEVHQ